MRQTLSLLRQRARLVLRHHDRGAALPLVLIIYLVGFALVSAFLFAIVGSAQVAQTTQGSIQAQAAAEAGIAEAQATLPELAESGVNICVPFPQDALESDNDPLFKVSGTCDLAAEPATLTLTSSGYAEDGSTATVEAVFALEPPATSEGNEPAPEPEEEEAGSEAIMNLGGGSLTNSPNLKLESGDGSPAGVVTREATFVCNGLNIPGSVFAAGTLETQPCVVNGNLHIGGNLKTNNSSANNITGDVRLAGTDIVSNGVSHLLSGTMGDAKEIGRYNVYANGNVQLHQDSTVNGDLIVAGTGKSLINGKVKRNLFTNGTADVTSVVEGNMTALGTGQSTISGKVQGNVFTNGTVEVTGTVDGTIEARGTGVLRVSGKVSGDIRTDGTVLLDWNSKVEGNIVALGVGDNVFRTAPTGNVQVGGALKAEAWDLNFRGFVQAGTTVSLNNTKVRGTRPGTTCNVTRGSGTSSPWSQNDAEAGHRVCNNEQFPVFPALATVTPAAQVSPPQIDPWREYNYTESDWLGFTIQTVRGDECSDWNRWPGDGWGSLSELTTNTVIDLRACTEVSFNSWGDANANPKIGVDVALITQRAYLNSMKWSAKPNTTPRLWLVHPGALSNPPASCSTRTPAIKLENVKVDQSLRTLVYSAGGVNLSNSSLLGNVYAGFMCVGGESKLTFSQIGLPSWGSGGTGGSGTGTGGTGGTGGSESAGSESAGSPLSVPQIIGGVSAAPLSLRDVVSDEAP